MDRGRGQGRPGQQPAEGLRGGGAGEGPHTPRVADHLLPSGRRPTCVFPQASSHTQPPGEEPIPLDQLEASCRTSYGYSGAPSLHLQPGALLASLALLVLCLCPL